MIHKAVVPVAGLGTRLLPLTKSLPKELLPVGRKPTIHHVVDELAEAGIDQILLITARHKRSIEDYFDPDPELEEKLIASNQAELADSLRFPGVTFTMIRQSTPAGNGDAVRLARVHHSLHVRCVAVPVVGWRGDGHRGRRPWRIGGDVADLDGDHRLRQPLFEILGKDRVRDGGRVSHPADRRFCKRRVDQCRRHRHCRRDFFLCQSIPGRSRNRKNSNKLTITDTTSPPSHLTLQLAARASRRALSNRVTDRRPSRF